jgi:hypothetical protein
MNVNALPPETTLLSLSRAVPRCPERREDGRELTMLRIGCLLFEDRRELCLIRNISAGGALVRTYSQLTPGRPVALELRQGESVSGIVRWQEGHMVGIMFNQILDIVQLLAGSSDWPRPRQPRVQVQTLVKIQTGQAMQIAQALDLSQGGMKVRSKVGLPHNSQVLVEVSGLPHLWARVRWASEDTYGLVFAEPLALKALVGWVREQQARIIPSDTSAAGAAA